MPKPIKITLYACTRCHKRHEHENAAMICEFRHAVKPPFRLGTTVDVRTMLGTERRRVVGDPFPGLAKEFMWPTFLAPETVRPPKKRPRFEWYFSLDRHVALAVNCQSEIVAGSMCTAVEGEKAAP